MATNVKDLNAYELFKVRQVILKGKVVDWFKHLLKVLWVLTIVE
jgi:hypothetical protein